MCFVDPLQLHGTLFNYAISLIDKCDMSTPQTLRMKMINRSVRETLCHHLVMNCAPQGLCGLELISIGKSTLTERSSSSSTVIVRTNST